ncbi:MAG: outer membrane beta-barrel protein [Bacteroidales bacterium]|jgi:hypothetical protein|nr:outer membrane beta-barrel protein [Bacteroidales bacterium]
MKKIIALVVIAVFTSFSINAQEDEYEKGQWQLGPHIGVINPGINAVNESNGFNFGVYGGYSFTKLLGTNAGILYSNECNFDYFRQDYLKIPATFNFQFNQIYLGLGLQYNLSLSDIEYLNLKTSSMNYLSGIFEFGFSSSYLPLYYGGIIDIGLNFRYLIRLGYALNPLSYSTHGGIVGGIMQEDSYYETQPFFIEIAIQYNIGQHFSIFNPMSKKSVVRRR